MKYINIIVSSAVVCLLLAVTVEVRAEQQYGESSAGVLIGVSSKDIDFIVRDKNNLELARFNGSEGSPLLIVTTKDLKYDDWSSWGLSVEFGHTQFELDTQVDKFEKAYSGLGTSVDGSYTYGMATFSLHSDNKRANRMDEEGFILGLSAGLALVKAKGRVVYTETDFSSHNISVNEMSPIMGLYGEYRNSGFFVRLQAMATGGTEEGASDPGAVGNKYSIVEAALNLGYSIYF